MWNNEHNMSATTLPQINTEDHIKEVSSSGEIYSPNDPDTAECT